MIFEQNKGWEKLGEKLGFGFSYLMFTTILFLILNYVKKYDISYFNVALITLTITLAGIILKRLLK